MTDLSFTLFKSLNEDLLERTGFVQDEFVFSYKDSYGTLRGIKKKDNSDLFNIEIPGKNCDWDPSVDGLIINGKCRFSDLRPLFSSDSGVSNTDSILGLALIVYSTESSRRAVYQYEGSISSHDNSKTFDIRVELDQGLYRKSISLRTILFLKQASASPLFSYYSNTEGFVLGTLSTVHLYIEENSPEFPTKLAKLGSKEPLWKLDVSWKDPRMDLFSDTVCIFINESFPGFKEIWGDNADSRKKGALKVEIYSSALLQLINLIKSDADPIIWDDTVNGNPDTISEGSVSDFICYIINEKLHDIKMDDDAISLKLRKILGGE